jgi:cation transport regulator ChaC
LKITLPLRGGTVMSIHYFAYGSCMDEVDFKRTVEEFKILGAATLRNYRLGFSLFTEGRAGGVADVIPCEGEEVQGVLYSFREGVHTGSYERIEVEVEHQGKKMKVFTYQVVSKAEKEFAPSQHYFELIMNGLNKFATENHRSDFTKRLQQQFGIIDNRNKRRFERVGLGIPLTLDVHQWSGEGSFQGQSHQGTLDDLSEGGLKISSKVPLAIDMFLKIHLPPEANLTPIVGRIIRCDVVGDEFKYGCMVTGLSLSDRKQLESYIQSQI